MRLRSIESARQIQVEVSSGNHYPVATVRGWPEDLLEDVLRAHSKVLILSQKGLEKSVLEPFLKTVPGIPRDHIYLIEQGEHNKHIDRLGDVYNHFIRQGVDRHSLILALGGGVVGDFAGFVAATLMRGISYVQLPTTLLAAVDSSVGGKTAVNVDVGKNMVGAFHHPGAVIFNVSTLRTLPEREWICGHAEIVKHAFLDPGHLEKLEGWIQGLSDPESGELQEAVFESVRFKASVVAQDENEKGLRSILNLGHTTGHAIESATNYRTYNHGEAVSRGLMTALFLSEEMLGLPGSERDRMIQVIKDLHLPVDTGGLSGEELLKHMKYDKKNRDGKTGFVLLEKSGKPVYDQRVPDEAFLRAWKKQREFAGS